MVYLKILLALAFYFTGVFNTVLEGGLRQCAFEQTCKVLSLNFLERVSELELSFHLEVHGYLRTARNSSKLLRSDANLNREDYGITWRQRRVALPQPRPGFRGTFHGNYRPLHQNSPRSWVNQNKGDFDCRVAFCIDQPSFEFSKLYPLAHASFLNFGLFTQNTPLQKPNKRKQETEEVGPPICIVFC